MSKAGDYLSKRVYNGVVTPSKEEAAWMRKKIGGCAGSAHLPCKQVEMGSSPIFHPKMVNDMKNSMC